MKNFKGGDKVVIIADHHEDSVTDSLSAVGLKIGDEGIIIGLAAFGRVLAVEFDNDENQQFLLDPDELELA